MNNLDSNETQEKSYMVTTQVGNMLFWTNPGSSIPQNSSFSAINIQSHKPSKKNGQEMLEAFSEVSTNP